MREAIRASQRRLFGEDAMLFDMQWDRATAQGSWYIDKIPEYTTTETLKRGTSVSSSEPNLIC